MKLTLILANLIFSGSLLASGTDIEGQIKKLNWNGVDVVYIEDNRFPTYDLSIYFADGSLSEKENERGVTNSSFSLLDSGTKNKSQKEIMEEMEFLGTDYSVDVTHEYTRISVSGLTKDLRPSMNQICSLMRTATYPADVVQKELEIVKTGIETMVSSPRSLAERVFREISMSNTPYSYPVAGKLKDFENHTSEKLRERMDYFLNNVQKRIYLTGPKSVLELEQVLAKECKFQGKESDVVSLVNNPQRRNNKMEFVFVPVPDANQVQLRIGRFINHNETGDTVLNDIASEFLGGGFTSRLMREVRVKRGLTYSIGSFISSQKQYGRSGISTFTKNETVKQLIEVIDNTVSQVKRNGIKKAELSHATDGMIGGYPFRFESNRSFLSQLLLLDHVGRPYSELFNYKEAVAQYNAQDVAKKIDEIFSMKNQTILVLGDKSIEAKLRELTKKYGKLRVVDYKNYL